MRSVLQLRDVGWLAGTRAVIENISFDVAPGEFVAIMGRNGAGKSTLFDVIAGLRQPASGEVSLDGRPLHRWTTRERARLLAHLPQHVRTDRTLDAESLVLMGRYAHQAAGWFESDGDRAIVEDTMRRCDCLDFRRRSLGTLSGGERQRVLLAAALAQRARVLLLDEPATFLDVDQQLQCFSVLRAEADRGVACLAVTHDINLALTFCTRLIVLAAGAIARDVPVTSALDDPTWLSLLSDRMSVGGVAEMPLWVQYR